MKTDTQAIISLAKSCFGKSLAVAAGAGVTGLLALNHFEGVYGAEKMMPMMAVACGGGGTMLLATVVGGRVVWKKIQSLPDENELPSSGAVSVPTVVSMSEEDKPWDELMSSLYHPGKRDLSLPLGWRIVRTVDGEYDPRSGKLIEFKPHAGEPHMMISGTTGTGKSKAALRPIAAVAATLGYQVVIMDKSGKDFSIFRGHPNIHIVSYDADTLPDMASRIYNHLLLPRMKMLAEHPRHPGSIEEMPSRDRPPRVLIIFDELGNAFQLLNAKDNEAAKAFNIAMLQVAQEGRAAGVHLLVATQKPSGRQINTDFRDQLKKLTFALESAYVSNMVNAMGDPERGLPAAHELEPGEAIFDSNRGQFHLRMRYPSNEELDRYLRRHLSKVRVAGLPTWLGPYQPEPISYEDLPRENDVAVSYELNNTEGGDGSSFPAGDEGWDVSTIGIEEGGDSPQGQQRGPAANPPSVVQEMRTFTSGVDRNQGTSPLPTLLNPQQTFQVVDRMMAILAADDGTLHPSLRGATMAQVRAASLGMVYLDKEVVGRILHKHLAAQRVLERQMRALGVEQPVALNGGKGNNGQDKAQTPAERIAYLLKHDNGAKPVLALDTVVPEEIADVTAAQIKAVQIGIESGMNTAEMITTIFPNTAEDGVEQLMMVLVAGDEGTLYQFEEGEDVPIELKEATRSAYEAARLGLENGLGVTAVARILFPQVKSPNNRHKAFVRAVRDREGIPVLGPTGEPQNS